MTLLTYDYTFVNNTIQQGMIRNKQITDGNASFTPDTDQIIDSGGGQASMKVKNLMNHSQYMKYCARLFQGSHARNGQIRKPRVLQYLTREGPFSYQDVTADSTSDTTFSGTFELQFMPSSTTFQCSFSFTKGEGATFDSQPNEANGIRLDYDPPSIEGSTATLDMNIIESL